MSGDGREAIGESRPSGLSQDIQNRQHRPVENHPAEHTREPGLFLPRIQWWYSHRTPNQHVGR